MGAYVIADGARPTLLLKVTHSRCHPEQVVPNGRKLRVTDMLGSSGPTVISVPDEISTIIRRSGRVKTSPTVTHPKRRNCWIRAQYAKDAACHWCTRLTTLIGNPNHYLFATRDHVYSRYHGTGSKRRNESVLACYECNQARSYAESKGQSMHVSVDTAGKATYTYKDDPVIAALVIEHAKTRSLPVPLGPRIAYTHTGVRQLGVSDSPITSWQY